MKTRYFKLVDKSGSVGVLSIKARSIEADKGLKAFRVLYESVEEIDAKQAQRVKAKIRRTARTEMEGDS